MPKIEVGNVSDIPSGKMKSVSIGDRRILVANVAGKLYAMNATCHHEGGPLDEGELDGDHLICPWHGATWNVTNGELVWFTMKLESEPTYPVIVEGDKVLVEA